MRREKCLCNYSFNTSCDIESNSSRLSEQGKVPVITPLIQAVQKLKAIGSR
jgi:hypothetical protein